MFKLMIALLFEIVIRLSTQADRYAISTDRTAIGLGIIAAREKYAEIQARHKQQRFHVRGS